MLHRSRICHDFVTRDILGGLRTGDHKRANARKTKKRQASTSASSASAFAKNTRPRRRLPNRAMAEHGRSSSESDDSFVADDEEVSQSDDLDYRCL